MVSRRAAVRLEDQIASLGDLSRQELAERWQVHFKMQPPKGIRRPLLMRALAYRLQAKRWGGLRRDTARRLRAVAAGSASEGPARRNKSAADVKPGMRLYREWNGKTHVVRACLCPRTFPIKKRLAPSAAAKLAKEWRRS